MILPRMARILSIEVDEAVIEGGERNFGKASPSKLAVFTKAVVSEDEEERRSKSAGNSSPFRILRILPTRRCFDGRRSKDEEEESSTASAGPFSVVMVESVEFSFNT